MRGEFQVKVGVEVRDEGVRREKRRQNGGCATREEEERTKPGI